MILLYHYEGPKCPSDTLLTAAAADYTGRAPGDPALTILRLLGKPPTLPALPGHFFSVSHSGGRWMCAAGSVPLGLDWFSVVADGVLRERLGPVWFLQPEPPEGFSLCLCAERPEPVQLRPLCPTP